MRRGQVAAVQDLEELVALQLDVLERAREAAQRHVVVDQPVAPMANALHELDGLAREERFPRDRPLADANEALVDAVPRRSVLRLQRLLQVATDRDEHANGAHLLRGRHADGPRSESSRLPSPRAIPGRRGAARRGCAGVRWPFPPFFRTRASSLFPPSLPSGPACSPCVCPPVQQGSEVHAVHVRALLPGIGPMTGGLLAPRPSPVRGLSLRGPLDGLGGRPGAPYTAAVHG